MKLFVRVAVAAAAGMCLLPLRTARGGLLDDLKNRARSEAQKRAVQAARDRLARAAAKGAAPPAERPEKFTGEYVGTFTAAGGRKLHAVAKVAAQWRAKSPRPA